MVYFQQNESYNLENANHFKKCYYLSLIKVVTQPIGLVALFIDA